MVNEVGAVLGILPVGILGDAERFVNGRGEIFWSLGIGGGVGAVLVCAADDTAAPEASPGQRTVAGDSTRASRAAEAT